MRQLRALRDELSQAHGLSLPHTFHQPHLRTSRQTMPLRNCPTLMQPAVKSCIYIYVYTFTYIYIHVSIFCLEIRVRNFLPVKNGVGISSLPFPSLPFPPLPGCWKTSTRYSAFSIPGNWKREEIERESKPSGAAAVCSVPSNKRAGRFRGSNEDWRKLTELTQDNVLASLKPHWLCGGAWRAALQGRLLPGLALSP